MTRALAIALAGAVAVGYLLGVQSGKSALDRQRAGLHDTIVAERIRLDTVYRTDTVRLWRAKTVYDTARIRDTVVRNDTVFIPRTVADAAVEACTAALATCEQRVAIADSQVTFWKDSVARILPKPDHRLWAAGASALTFLLTLLLVR